ncbi:hypothetical protein ACLOJK_022927 [Asimina triloba]
MVGNHHGLGGLPSPRTHESFPAGLRVLVVDDDLTWLKILEKMLKKCSYEVVRFFCRWSFRYFFYHTKYAPSSSSVDSI